jgi:hypothetical protein
LVDPQLQFTDSVSLQSQWIYFLLERKGMLNLRVKYIMDYAVRQGFKNQFVSLSLVLVPGILSGESNE